MLLSPTNHNNYSRYTHAVDTLLYFSQEIHDAIPNSISLDSNTFVTGSVDTCSCRPAQANIDPSEIEIKDGRVGSGFWWRVVDGWREI
jgi:hypothetical protein